MSATEQCPRDPRLWNSGGTQRGREAYDFLDEKRLLLAAEMLRQLDAYQRLQQELNSCAGRQSAPDAAVARHGLQGLSVYPAAALRRRISKPKHAISWVSHWRLRAAADG